MIKINKGQAPVELIKAGIPLTNQMKLDYDASPDKYKKPKEGFIFSTIYNSKPVKDELRKKQYNKCCFSEAKFVSDDSHVEHFRPKGRIDTWPNGDTNYPGYYWLAYEWSNLFLCKSSINSKYKRNFFPLEDDSKRNRNHHDTNVEIALLINPSVDEPREHIKFNNDEPFPLTEKGKITINLLKLRTPELEEARRKMFGYLLKLKLAIDLLIVNGMDKNDPEIINFIEELRDAVKPGAEFSSMAIDLLSGWPLL